MVKQLRCNQYWHCPNSEKKPMLHFLFSFPYSPNLVLKKQPKFMGVHWILCGTLRESTIIGFQPILKIAFLYKLK